MLVRLDPRAVDAAAEEARRREVEPQQSLARSDVSRVERGRLLELALHPPGESGLANRVGALRLLAGRAPEPEVVDRDTGIGLDRFLEFVPGGAPLLLGEETAASQVGATSTRFGIDGRLHGLQVGRARVVDDARASALEVMHRD